MKQSNITYNNGQVENRKDVEGKKERENVVALSGRDVACKFAHDGCRKREGERQREGM